MSGGDSFWKSPAGTDNTVFWDNVEDGRIRSDVKDNKRAHHNNDLKGPSYNRLVEARERLKSLEQNMSTLRHSAQMSKARFVSERASLVEENSKLQQHLKALIERAEYVALVFELEVNFKNLSHSEHRYITNRIQHDIPLPEKDIWEQRMKMTDEHPDDVAMAKRIEQAEWQGSGIGTLVFFVRFLSYTQTTPKSETCSSGTINDDAGNTTRKRTQTKSNGKGHGRGTSKKT